MSLKTFRQSTQIVWPFLLIVAIFISSSGRGPQIPQLPWNLSVDKVGHFLVFGLLATLIYRYLVRDAPSRRHFLYSTLVTFSYGIADELFQSTNPHRYFEFADIGADLAGAVVAVWVYRNWEFYRRLLERPL